MKEVEPFPTTELVPYATAFLSGFVVEHYQVVLFEAAQNAEAAMTRKLHEMCAAEIPGDTFRNLQIHPVFSGRTFKHILAPVWLLTYTYGARAFQCAMNGCTGTVRGEYPKSPWKVALLVLAILIVVVIALSLGGKG